MRWQIIDEQFKFLSKMDLSSCTNKANKCYTEICKKFQEKRSKMRQRILTDLGKNPLVKVLSPPLEIKA